MKPTWKNNHPTQQWERSLSPDIKQSIILNTHTLGINKITQLTVPEFYKRYVMYQLALGKKPQLAYAHVLGAVGLVTSAQPLSYAAFKRNIIRELELRVTI